ATFSRRARWVVRFGLSSTGDQSRPPTLANTIGTRCGLPWASIVARRATAARSMRSSISASVSEPKVRAISRAGSDLQIGNRIGRSRERSALVTARHDRRDRTMAFAREKARFGVTMFPTGYAIPPADLARAVEERGLDSLFFPEHTHIPASRKTPFPGGGEL